MSESADHGAKLAVIDLSFSFDSEKGSIHVLNHANLGINENEFVCLVGPSGCGKSTLLNLIAGFLKPQAGKILLDGVEITDVSWKRGMVFQEESIFPWLTIEQNLAYGLESRQVPQKERERVIDRYLKMVQLEHFRHYYARELSGGMKKRVELGRTLANEPEILLMDEPFGALDALTKEFLQIEMIEIWQKTRKTVVFVTHDLEEALFLGDRIVIMFSDSDRPLKSFDVPFPRPRDISIKSLPEFQNLRRSFINEFKQNLMVKNNVH